ncbi:CD2-associated protein isoform X1 [Scyliorhinus canicula]|uniref:CD2-associated protein isoform X1 n=1 Tax=Scyliorhinus canicula TaxID=7830 RepID=UPI0018F39649|nr:CD2-associated protein isoform X1 [Scyliorhinus canicula]
MVEVTVEYDYEAEHVDELTLKVGDLIKNVRKLEEEGWCEGELNGKRGLFPDNFVKELKKDGETKEESPVIKREKSGNVANLVQRMSHFGFPVVGFPPQPKSLRRKRLKKKICEALFDYIPQNEDELEIKAGDVIEIIDEVEEGWWKGVLNEKTGLFPSNFVKELIDPTEDGESNEVLSETDVLVKELIAVGPTSPTSPIEFTGNESPIGAGTTAQPKKIRGVGFGDIFKEGSVKLKSRSSSAELEDKKSEKQITPTSNAEAVKSEPENKHKVKEYCKAVFPYEATNLDELNFKEGDRILLINKDTGDRGWWKGELNGKQGVFPDNFVVVVSEAEREAIAAPRPSAKLPPRPEHDDKPKKPLPPTKVQASKPEPPPAEKKLDVKKIHSDRIDSVSSKTEEKDDQKSTKPTAPMVPPKKPSLPMKGHPFRASMPPRRPEKPSLPLPLPKTNGELPYNRAKVDFDSTVLGPKSEMPSSLTRPKSVEIAPEIDLMSFDSVELSGAKLNHPTASRPRMPGRRPPSLFIVNHPSLGESHLDKSPKMIKEEEEVQEETAKPKPSDIVKKPSFKQNTGIINFAEMKETTEIDNRNRATIEELQAQMTDLMTFVERLKIQHKKELTELRNDFEEEKKQRTALQLEIDKLKKAVQSTCSKKSTFLKGQNNSNFNCIYVEPFSPGEI